MRIDSLGSTSQHVAAMLPPPVTDDEEHAEDVGFAEVGHRLVQDADLSLLELPEDTTNSHTVAGPMTDLEPQVAASIHSTTSARTSHTPTQATRIPLKHLFIYPDEAAPPGELAFYWHGGIRNLDTERAGYELVHKSLQTVSE